MQNGSFEENLRFNSVAIRLVAVMHSSETGDSLALERKGVRHECR